MLEPYGPKLGTEDVRTEMAGCPVGTSFVVSDFTVFNGGSAAGDWLKATLEAATGGVVCVGGCGGLGVDVDMNVEDF